jgi:hypothetical protein
VEESELRSAVRVTCAMAALALTLSAEQLAGLKR